MTHQSPAFLGEIYPLSISIAQLKTYKLKSILITFCELLPEEGRAHSKSSGSRKASLVGGDSAEWSYALYVGDGEKLEHHHCTVNNPKESEEVRLGMQFREEGPKKFEVIFRCTIGKEDDKEGAESEFTVESKECFELEVLCPFNIATEWITSESLMRESSAANGESEINLPMREKSVVEVKIATGSYPQVDIHNVSLKIRDAGIPKLIEDCTNPADTWQDWPVTLSNSESLSLAFSVRPLTPFNSQQVADVEILWSRTDRPNSKQVACSIPLPFVRAANQGVDVHLVSGPCKAVRGREFFVAYEVRNRTGVVVSVEVKVEASGNFFVAGEVEGKVMVPPNEVELISFGMLPLRSGKLELPAILLSTVSKEGVKKTLMDSNSKHPVYVLPA